MLQYIKLSASKSLNNEHAKQQPLRSEDNTNVKKLQNILIKNSKTNKQKKQTTTTTNSRCCFYLYKLIINS